MRKTVFRFLGAFCLLAFAVPGLAGAMGQSGLTPKELLGKKLFFDANLSTPTFQSCAVCHLPEVGWTGPDMMTNAHGAVYEGAVKGRFGNRKPPSAAYATLSPIFHQDSEGDFVGGNFWDGRATGEHLGNPAADQALGPFLNPVEQNNPSKKAVCMKVAASQYAYLWEQVWGAPINCGSYDDVEKNYDRIGRSIAAYEDSSEVNQFSSKFDYVQKGEAEFTQEEKLGMELFNGRAKCSQCHPAPLFTAFSYDNLGTPKNPKNPFYHMDKVYLDDGSSINPEGKKWVDTGLYGFLKTRPEWKSLADKNKGKHKEPTLRNVDLRVREGFVKAYMHNGFFKTLKGVVHFYNTRDVKMACPEGKVYDPTDDYTEAMAMAKNCWPAPEVMDNVNKDQLGDLGLTDGEEDAIVAFLKTLSDGYMKPPTGMSLYKSYCMGCHGSADPGNMDPPSPAPRKVIGARPCSIKGAIYGTYVFKKGVWPMRFMKYSFTDEQIQMISDYLNSFGGIMGQQRFITTCAGCHGLDAKGGRVDEEVWGEDAYEIKEAIYDEDPMRFLRCLPRQDVFDIGDYLQMMDYMDDDYSKDDDDSKDDGDYGHDSTSE